MPGGAQLKADILSTSACSLCGACLDWCPYLTNLEDHLVLRFDCPVNDGRCYAVCPRTMTDWEVIQQQCLPDLPAGLEMGGYLAIYRAQAQSAVTGQQDGGVVSTLLLTALKEQLVDGLLLTGSADPLVPAPFLTNEMDEIARAAGSRFMSSPGLRKISEAQSKGWQRLAVVGRPCQVQALRKMQVHQTPDRPGMDILSIGLFCMWSLSWSFMDYLQAEYPEQKFSRMAIPQHGVELNDGVTTTTIATEKVREYIRPGCNYCLDMTSELADISVGNFEAEAGWNTLVVRSKQGAELLARAEHAGLIRLDVYPPEELERLKLASLRKKARNLNAISEGVAAGRLSEIVNLAAPVYQAIRDWSEGMVKS